MPDITHKNKAIFLFTLFVFFINIKAVFSQNEQETSEELVKMGFENVSTRISSGNIYASIENNIFRWEPLAISAALDIISKNVNDSVIIHLITIKKGIPTNNISVNALSWKSFRNGNINKDEISENLTVNQNINEAWQILKNSEKTNKNTGKTDVVIYPHFLYENTQLRKIYETQINIAPAAEFSLWKGNKFTGQVIFPIHNELGYEGNFIRPGYVTISQDFRLKHSWFGNIATGNFNNSRYGIAVKIWHPLKNENWHLEIKAGLTGYSHFFDNNWRHGALNTITWSSSLSWYYSRYHLIFKGGISQYIYGDKGLFASCTRLFGETTVGFYAQYNEHNFNGGFNVSIPFPFRKRCIRNRIRINIPNHYKINYNSGNELLYAQNFTANIGINSINYFNFTKSIKYEIINLLKYTP